MSFGVPSRRFPTKIASIGGVPDTPLKKENGAAFTTPSRERVVTHAIGRGTMAEIKRR